MIKDLRQIHGFCSSLEKVTLVNNSRRITCPHFHIHVPSLMNGITPSLDGETVSIKKNNILNEDKSEFSSSIKLAGCIKAKSIHGYRFKHDGWIPEYKMEKSTYEKMTMEDGTGGDMKSSSSSGMTEGTPDKQHPPHEIIKAFQMISNSFKKFVFNTIVSTTMVHTNSTEVDYQELNRKYITKGAYLYGSFISGGDSDEFVITAIDDVIPYYDEDEDNNTNDEI